jgi:hypothetical protein
MARGDSKPPKVRKTRWYHQLWQVFQLTRGVDPAITWWLLAAFLGTMAVALVIGFFVNQVVYLLIMGVPFAMLAAMLVLSRRAETATYRSIEGQPGAALAALRSIRRGWEFPEEPVAVDPRTQDMVFRGVGRAGVVLAGEGPSRVARMLENERKKVARVLPNVPIHLFQVGSGEGQIQLRKLPREVQRLKPTLTKAETAELTKRLKALGGMRMPMPKGVDPMRARPDRKGLKGR